MDDYLESMFLGVVQGVAEFLPISSSGHLLILGDLIHKITGREIDPEANQQLIVALHVGTLLSILVVYRDTWLRILSNLRLIVAICLATLPLVIIALTPLRDDLESSFGTPLVAGIGLLVTAVLLTISQRVERGERSLEQLSPIHAVVVGLFQTVALLPGVSRSGSTISGGLMLGYQREAAAGFSFFIAVPAILGATVLTVVKAWRGRGSSESPEADFAIGALLAGAVVSFVVGWATLRWLLSIIARGRLYWFAIYCALVGAATILWQCLS